MADGLIGGCLVDCSIGLCSDNCSLGWWLLVCLIVLALLFLVGWVTAQGLVCGGTVVGDNCLAGWLGWWLIAWLLAAGLVGG